VKGVQSETNEPYVCSNITTGVRWATFLFCVDQSDLWHVRRSAPFTRNDMPIVHPRNSPLLF
jgi:hypothetical protein